MATAIDKSYGLITSQKRLDMEKLAKQLATTMGEDEGLNKSINTAIEVSRQNKDSTHNVMLALFDMMEVDRDTLECEAMDSWPVPGSKKKDVGDNGAFDLYDYKDPSSGAVKKDSFYANVGRNHPIGEGILSQKKDVDDQLEGGKISEGDAQRKKGDIDGDYTTFIGKLRMGVSCYFHMKAMRTAFPKSIEVEFSKTMAKGKETWDLSSPKLICVSNKVKKGIAKYYTVVNFLRLDIEKALAAGGAYEDVITSNKREKDEEAGIDETKHVKITSNKDFEDATIAINAWINHAFKSTKDTKEIRAFYSGAGSDDRLITLFGLEDDLSKLWGMKDLRDRYEALKMDTETPDRKAA